MPWPCDKPSIMNDRMKRAARTLPGVLPLIRRVRRARYDRAIAPFLAARDGRARRFPDGIVYEATMRCNLRCDFCYVGELLNIEGQWRQELPLEVLRRAFPERAGLQVSLTGGEVFVRKDIEQVLDLFRGKGYTCGYLTTNGTLIDDERARALAKLAAAGFLKHVSVSIDGPTALHDAARGIQGTFARAAAGLRRLQAASAESGAPLRVSVNTTVSAESLPAIDRMADVAAELGVDAIGVNHLMFATPEEVTETLRLLGHSDRTAIATFVTDRPGVSAADVRSKLDRLAASCRVRGIRLDARPKVGAALVDGYYSPGAPLSGRCLYPFLNARVGFSGKMFFCPFIRIELGDLSQAPLEAIWNGETSVRLRRTLLEHRLFPVCRRCCKVELERPC